MANIEAAVVDMNGNGLVDEVGNVDDGEFELDVSVPTTTPTRTKPKKGKKTSQVPVVQPPPQPQQTLNDVNNDITKMVQDFNVSLQTIADTRAKLSAVQSKSLSKSLRINKLDGEAKEAMEAELNEYLLQVADLRDVLCDQQNELIVLAIRLFKLKDFFHQNVANENRAQLEKAQAQIQAQAQVQNQNQNQNQQPKVALQAAKGTTADQMKQLQEQAKILKQRARDEAQATINQHMVEAKMQTAEAMRGARTAKHKIPKKPPQVVSRQAPPTPTQMPHTNGATIEEENSADDADVVEDADVDINANVDNTVQSAEDAKKQAENQLSPDQHQMLQALLQRAQDSGVDINTLKKQ